jgi:hypothetical protein
MGDNQTGHIGYTLFLVVDLATGNHRSCNGAKFAKPAPDPSPRYVLSSRRSAFDHAGDPLTHGTSSPARRSARAAQGRSRAITPSSVVSDLSRLQGADCRAGTGPCSRPSSGHWARPAQMQLASGSACAKVRCSSRPASRLGIGGAVLLLGVVGKQAQQNFPLEREQGSGAGEPDHRVACGCKALRRCEKGMIHHARSGLHHAYGGSHHAHSGFHHTRRRVRSVIGTPVL